MFHLFGVIISSFSLIEMLPLLGDSYQHLVLISPLMFIFLPAHLIFIKSRTDVKVKTFLPTSIVYGVD